MQRLVLPVVIALLGLCLPNLGWANDQEIAEQIVGKLEKQKQLGKLKGFELNMQVQSGVVTLSGRVSTPQQQFLALDIARRIRGVKKVVNSIQIKPQAAQIKPQAAPARAAGPKMLPVKSSPIRPLPKRPVQTAPPKQKNFVAGVSSALKQAFTPKLAGSVTNARQRARRVQKQPAAKASHKQMVQRSPSLNAPSNAKSIGSAIGSRPVGNRPLPALRSGSLQSQHGHIRPVDHRQPTAAQMQKAPTPAAAPQAVRRATVHQPTAAKTPVGSGRVAAKPKAPAKQQPKAAPQPPQAAMTAEQQRAAAMYQQQMIAMQQQLAARGQQMPQGRMIALPAGQFRPGPNGQLPQFPNVGNGGAIQIPVRFVPVRVASQVPLAYAQVGPPRGNLAMRQPGNGAPNGGQRPVPMHMASAGSGIVPAQFDHPQMPAYSWPSYAAHPNYGAVTYPRQYSPTAWPYIGPFYPYPQVPLGWRKVTLKWKDGWWFLDFKDRY